MYAPPPLPTRPLANACNDHCVWLWVKKKNQRLMRNLSHENCLVYAGCLMWNECQRQKFIEDNYLRLAKYEQMFFLPYVTVCKDVKIIQIKLNWVD